jgi:hypothetical protein
VYKGRSDKSSGSLQLDIRKEARRPAGQREVTTKDDQALASSEQDLQLLRGSLSYCTYGIGSELSLSLPYPGTTTVPSRVSMLRFGTCRLE